MVVAFDDISIENYIQFAAQLICIVVYFIQFIEPIGAVRKTTKMYNLLRGDEERERDR